MRPTNNPPVEIIRFPIRASVLDVVGGGTKGISEAAATTMTAQWGTASGRTRAADTPICRQ